MIGARGFLSHDLMTKKKKITKFILSCGGQNVHCCGQAFFSFSGIGKTLAPSLPPAPPTQGLGCAVFFPQTLNPSPAKNIWHIQMRMFRKV